jgi:predicted nucleic acid-binding Zn ribbon protein
MKTTAASVQAQVDTHEAVCSERWCETIARIKRIENIMIGSAGTTIVLLLTMLLRG